VKLTDPARATTITLYKHLEPGKWNRATEFSSIDPSSSIVQCPLYDGKPTVYLQHNGVLQYRFFLDEERDYEFTLEAKNDFPGPLGLRVFFSRSVEPPPLKFDKADNSFSEQHRRVHLTKGLNELTLYYNSFNRTKTEMRNYED